MLQLVLAVLSLAPAPTLGVERFEVDARHSVVGFDGSSSLHDFSGRTHAITADLRADRADPGRLVGGAVWIEARTLDTDNSSRDKEMRGLLDAEHHPQIVFQLDAVKGKLNAGRGELTASGRFTINGIEKPHAVEFHVDPVPAAPDNSGHDLRVQGQARFKMTEHGIERPGVLLFKVDDEVRVWLDLQLRPVPDVGVEARVRPVQVEEEFVPSSPGVVPWKRAGLEFVWSSGANRLWERRLEPTWILAVDTSSASIDPRTGAAQPAPGFALQALSEFAKPAAPGTRWTTTVEEAKGRRTLTCTFLEDVPARLPTWAFDPKSWANGPAPLPAH